MSHEFVKVRKRPWATLKVDSYVGVHYPAEEILRLVGHTANAVLSVILCHQKSVNGRVPFPSRATLARKCRCSEATVKRAVAELVAAGLVRVTQRSTNRGWLSNEYELHPKLRLRQRDTRVADDPRLDAPLKSKAHARVTDDPRARVTSDPPRSRSRKNGDSRKSATARTVAGGPMASLVEQARRAAEQKQARGATK